MPSLSLIILFYNDEKTVFNIISDANLFFESLKIDYEIIGIDDCSNDGTFVELQKVKEIYDKLIIVRNPINLGVGASFGKAVAYVSKEYTCYTDGDYQYNINNILYMMDELTNYEIVSGYRHKRSEGFFRYIVSKHYNFLVNSFYNLGIRDTNSALKIYKTEKLKTLVLRSNYAFYDAEVLIKLKTIYKYRIKEVKIDHLKRKFGNAMGLNHKNTVDVLTGLISKDYADYRTKNLLTIILYPWILLLILLFRFRNKK